MTSLIVHRGPDDEGYFSAPEWLSMGFRRLSILDLSAKGHQPMLCADKRYAIVFNGEIYNYREIREELVSKGFAFFSDTDTEVILNAYKAWGEKCVDKFVGMFAFAVADLKRRTVVAFRDPLGIKPLFYFEDQEYLIFCSEIKSLLPYTELSPDCNSFNEYLVFRSVIGKETMFEGVKSLRPGFYANWELGRLEEHEYFNLVSTMNLEMRRPFEKTCEEVEEELKESVKIHLRSDVELGVQLSGGVDSSLITALASMESGKKLHSFSISFGETAFDESEYQKRVSERYHTEHHDYPFGEKAFTELIEKTLWHYEHPLNDPNTVATYFLTGQAKKYITVMLTGEGADESFLGYARFNKISLDVLRSRNWLYKHPETRKKLYHLWPFNKGRDVFKITKYNPPMYVLTYADLNLVDQLLLGDDSYMHYRKDVERLASGNILNEAILQDQLCDLPQWFWRADRIGMASAMELRVPYCTVPMFRLANSIPYSQRVYKGEKKAVLKKIAEKYIDKDQIYRKKIGFGMPLDEWMRNKGEYSSFFDDIANSMAFRQRDFVNFKHFSSIYKAHKAGQYKEKSCSFLWTYLNLELWHRIFFDGGWKKFA